MHSRDKSSGISSAIRFLHSRNSYYKFDDQERVVEVAVYHRTGADDIAARIGQLCDLRKLTLEDTDLTDTGIAHLHNLVQLRTLWLHSPTGTGRGFSHLGKLLAIQEVILSMPNLDGKGVAHLARQQGLSSLSITGGTFCDLDLAPLSALTSLRELSIVEASNVQGTFCAQFHPPCDIPNLTLGAYVTDEGMACISTLPKLETLYVEGPITDAGLLKLRALKKLKTLGITSEYVTHEGIAVAADLPELTCLSITGCPVDDRAIPALLRCTALEDLSFYTPTLSEAGLQRLRDALPRCSVSDIERDRRHDSPSADTVVLDRPPFNDDTPFETLLAQGTDSELINCTFGKIAIRYGGTLFDATAFSPVERVVMLVWHSFGIIGNGGFIYLFSGDFDNDPGFYLTAEAYKTADIEPGYEAFQQAFGLFPGGVVPADPEERARLYHESNHSARDAIDRMLWYADHVIEKKLAEFIRNNATQLLHLDGIH